MSKSLFTINTSRSNSETVIKLSGECDISNVDELNQTIDKILRSENHRIVLDVEELNFMGLCALTPVERAIERLRPIGGIVVVKKPSWITQWVFQFFGVSEKAVIVK